MNIMFEVSSHPISKVTGFYNNTLAEWNWTLSGNAFEVSAIKTAPDNLLADIITISPTHFQYNYNYIYHV